VGKHEGVQSSISVSAHLIVELPLLRWLHQFMVPDQLPDSITYNLSNALGSALLTPWDLHESLPETVNLIEQRILDGRCRV